MVNISLSQLIGELVMQEATIHRRASVAVGKAAADIERDAKIAAPVDTGNLRSSIGMDYHPNRLAAEIGPTAAYAAFVEYGTARSAPQPYLRPAADRHLPLFEQAMADIAGFGHG